MRNDRRRNRIRYWLAVDNTESNIWCIDCKKFVDINHFDICCSRPSTVGTFLTKKKLDSAVRRLYKEQHENKDFVYKIIKFIDFNTVEILKYKFI